MSETSSMSPEGSCPWCSGAGQYVYHSGACPKIKAIEYHPNGLIKRVEFKDGGEGFTNMDDFISTLPSKTLESQ